MSREALSFALPLSQHAFAYAAREQVCDSS
jgi:hypothetical protein